MKNELIPLEAEVLRLLLDGDDPILFSLREQLTHLVSVKREHTGVGCYTYFVFDGNAQPVLGEPSFAFGDVIPEIEGLDDGAGFVVFVKGGLLHMLEAYSYGHSWPMTIGRFVVSYQHGGSRDMAALRCTRGWPK